MNAENKNYWVRLASKARETQGAVESDVARALSPAAPALLPALVPLA